MRPVGILFVLALIAACLAFGVLTGCSSVRLGPFHDDPPNEIACGADSDCTWNRLPRHRGSSLAPGYVCRFLEIDHPAVCVPPDARHYSEADPNFPAMVER